MMDIGKARGELRVEPYSVILSVGFLKTARKPRKDLQSYDRSCHAVLSCSVDPPTLFTYAFSQRAGAGSCLHPFVTPLLEHQNSNLK